MFPGLLSVDVDDIDLLPDVLSTVLEEWDAADAHFAEALSLEERIHGHALLPRTRYWQARFLRARGVRPEVVVLVGVTRSVEWLGILLGVWKCGGVYCPVDVGWPPERVGFVVGDVAPGAVVA